MATYTGKIMDASGNIFYPECMASDVIMSDNTTAQDKINDIDAKYTTLQTRIAALNTQFQAVLDAN